MIGGSRAFLPKYFCYIHQFPFFFSPCVLNALLYANESFVIDPFHSDPEEGCNGPMIANIHFESLVAVTFHTTTTAVVLDLAGTPKDTIAPGRSALLLGGVVVVTVAIVFVCRRKVDGCFAEVP